MADKVILMVRTSTTTQESSMNEQEKELYRYARQEGYTDENITLIPEFGVSGRKRGRQITATTSEGEIITIEEERSGIRQMKKLIENDPQITTVYAWEVSRLTRRIAVGTLLLEYLADKKVNLKILKPTLALLNPDGTVNTGSKTTISLLFQLAENEMEVKMERFHRAKEARRKQGYYIGGPVTYGYKIAEDKKLVIDEPNAEVVRMIFTMFLSGKYSYRSLAKEVHALGFFPEKPVEDLRSRIGDIVNNLAYAGHPSGTVDNRHGKAFKTEGNIYPPIVSEEMVMKCREIAEKNIRLPKWASNNIYFGRSILRCPNCGRVMPGVKTTRVYKCTRCENKNINYNINLVDSALWAYAIPRYTKMQQTDNEEQKKAYEIHIGLLKQKVEVADADILSIKARMEKIEHKAYVEGAMDIARADKFIAEPNAKILDHQKNIADFNNQITEYQNLLMVASGNYDGEYIEDVSSVTDDKVRDKIIKQCVSWCTVEKLPDNHWYNILTIFDKEDKPTRYLLDGRNHKIYSEFTPEGVGLVEVEGAYMERIKKKEKDRQANIEYQRQRREQVKNNPEALAKQKEQQAKAQLRYRQRKIARQVFLDKMKKDDGNK